jgi:hypothetical protein
MQSTFMSSCNLMTVQTILDKIKKGFISQLLKQIITNFTLHAGVLIGNGHEVDSHGSIPDKSINYLHRFTRPDLLLSIRDI